MIYKMLSVRASFLIPLLVTFVNVFAGDQNNSLWNTFRFYVSPTGSIYNSGSVRNSDGSGSVSSFLNYNDRNNNFQNLISERSISSGSPFLNSPQHISSNIYKSLNFNHSKLNVPAERTVLSTVVLDESSANTFDKFNSNKPIIFDVKRQIIQNSRTPVNNTVTIIRKNTRKPFATFIRPNSNTVHKPATHLSAVTAVSTPSAAVKPTGDKLKPSVRLDEDDEDEDEDDDDDEESEDEEDEDEDDDDGTGFDSGLVESEEEEEEDETDDVDTSQSTDADTKDDERDEGIYQISQ